jgi:hypothetical protein
VTAPDLQQAFDAIDAENAGDPNGKELDHSERAVRWVRTLRPDASDELLLAARAHHVRRWEIPRSDEPDGRAGYLRWKRRLQQHHAEVVGRVLSDSGFDVARVQSLVKKERLMTDPDAQSLEDALALVFLETQLAELDEKLDEDHMVDVLAKTLWKMTPAGRAAAAQRTYDARGASLVQRAVAAL